MRRRAGRWSSRGFRHRGTATRSNWRRPMTAATRRRRSTSIQSSSMRAGAAAAARPRRRCSTGCRIRQVYDARRRREGTADFDDLLIWARDLVRDRPDVRAYFEAKFRCILVDEFQDTDPLQAELIVVPVRRRRAGDGLARRAAAAGQPLRRRRPEAVDLPLPARRHRDVRRRQARVFGGDVREIVQNFRSVRARSSTG